MLKYSFEMLYNGHMIVKQRKLETGPEMSSKTQRKILTKAFFGVIENWQLSNQEKAKLLGWDYAQKRSVVDAMRKKGKEVDCDDDKIQRMIEIINIHKNLRILYPYNKQLVYQWVKQKRDVFNQYCALDVMLEDGLFGITAIRKYLEHARTA